MMNNTQKIKAIIDKYNLRSQASLAKMLNISPQLLAYWIKSDFMDIDKVKASFPELSSEWLLTGEGQMLNNSPNSGTIINDAGHDNFFTPSEKSDESELVKHLRDEVDYLRNLVNTLTSKQ